MKKISLVLILVLSLISADSRSQSMSFGDQIKEIIIGRDKYKIAVKTVKHGGVVYIPMRKVFNGKLLREWIEYQQAFRSRSEAMEVIEEWQAEEAWVKKQKRVEYIHIN
jgi:hypothetical protein